MHAYFFPMYANFAPDDARQADVIHTLFFTVARHKCGHLQRYNHIYYMAGSASGQDESNPAL